MLDLDRDLQRYAGYLDELVEPVAIPVIEPDRAPGRPLRYGRLTPALVAVVVVTVAIGLLVVLDPFGSDDTPFVEEPTTVTTTQTTTSATGIAPSTTAASGVSLPRLVWTRVDSDEVFQRTDLSSLALTDAGLFAAGTSRAGEDDDATILFSTDGMEWSSVQGGPGVFGGEGSQSVNSIIEFGDRLIAVGVECLSNEEPCRAAVWIADDGEAWQRLPHDPVFEAGGWFGMRDVVLSDGILLAVGDTIWTSSDGVVWAEAPDSFVASACMRSLVEFDEGIAAVGTDVTEGAPEGAAWWTQDGRAWTRIPPTEDLFPTEENLGISLVSDVVATPSALVAVGMVGTQPAGGDPGFWRSTNGLTWTRIEALRTGRSEELRGVGYSNGLLVAVGDQWGKGYSHGLAAVGGQGDLERGLGPALVLISADDGLSWDRLPDDPVFGDYYTDGTSMGDVIAIDGKFIVVGANSDSAVVWIGTIED